MKTRKALILPVILSMLLGLVMISPAGAPTLPEIAVVPSSITEPYKAPGSTFTVEVWIYDVVGLLGIEFRLAYNTIVLTANSVTKGPLWAVTYVFKDDVFDDEGYVYFAAMEFDDPAGPSINGPQLIATIDFTVDSLGESNLHLYGTIPGDPDYMDHTTADGYFRNMAAEEIVYSASLERRRAWPEHHDYYLGKDEDYRNDLFAIVLNDGTVGTTVKVVFSVTDDNMVPIGDWETDPIPLMPGEMVGEKSANRYMCPWPTPFPSLPPEVGKYYATAECWVDADFDNVPETPIGSVRTFSFGVMEHIPE